MAIIVRTAILSADQDAHDRLEQQVEAAITRQGGPPDGMMVHIAHPSGQDFVIVEVWKSESVFRSWWNDVMEPAFVAAGLTAGEPEINPVWSLARP
jgi:hypothetical protein